MSYQSYVVAAYAVFGAAKALSYGVAAVPAFVIGVLTASAGAILLAWLAIHARRRGWLSEALEQ